MADSTCDDEGGAGHRSRRGSRRCRAALCAAVAAWPGAVLAQSPASAPGAQPGPRPVEQGIGDLNPLQVSNRLEPVDLRRPTGWDRVYRLTGDARKDGGRGLFARFDGGIAAVFPWSVYEATPKGTRAPVPAGTMYYIGGLPASISAGAGAEAAEPDPSFNFLNRSAHAGQPARPVMHAETAIDTSARDRVRRGDAAVLEPEAPAGPTIWTNEAYRRERIAALLSAAAR